MTGSRCERADSYVDVCCGENTVNVRRVVMAWRMDRKMDEVVDIVGG